MSGLPKIALDPTGWFRQHVARPDADDNGCWWHASLPDDPDEPPGGRFDLPQPDGTCYLGESEAVAANELAGRFLAQHTLIPPEIYEGRVVSEVVLPEHDPAANLLSPDAALVGITGEIHTLSDYPLTAQWATAANRAGFGGLVYRARYTLDDERALALFGPAGAHPARGVVTSRPVIEVLVERGYPLARSKVPSSAAVHARVDDDALPEDS